MLCQLNRFDQNRHCVVTATQLVGTTDQDDGAPTFSAAMCDEHTLECQAAATALGFDFHSRRLADGEVAPVLEAATVEEREE